MDDVIVLAATRWKLRRAVKALNETLADLGLPKHPDKTFIGRVERGFDFLGYRLSPQGLLVAKQTRERFVERAARLCERERTGKSPPGALGAYLRRWRRWVRAGLRTGPSRSIQALLSPVAFDAGGSPRPGSRPQRA
jgi:hypothetical protein